MADGQWISRKDLEAEVDRLQNLVAKRDEEIEKLEGVIADQDDELADLEELVKQIDNPDLIIAAQSLIEGLRDRDMRAKTMVLSAIETGVTSDLWQVL